LAGLPIIETEGVPAASSRFAVTLPRSIGPLEPFVMTKLTATAGPDISPMPRATALKPVSFEIRAVTRFPNDAVAPVATGLALDTDFAGTVVWIEPDCCRVAELVADA
jgi:hypothetical protein